MVGRTSFRSSGLVSALLVLCISGSAGAAVAELVSRGKAIEIADERERFEAIAQDYARATCLMGRWQAIRNDAPC